MATQRKPIIESKIDTLVRQFPALTPELVEMARGPVHRVWEAIASDVIDAERGYGRRSYRPGQRNEERMEMVIDRLDDYGGKSGIGLKKYIDSITPECGAWTAVVDFLAYHILLGE